MSHPVVQIVDEPIHPDVVVPCPARRFQQRRAFKACPGCEYFQGIGQMAGEEPGDKPLRWHQKYVIRCSHVMERRTQMFQVLEE